MKYAGKEVQAADLLYVRRSSKAELALVLRVAESMVEVASLGATSGEGTSYAVSPGQIVARYAALGGNVALITPREHAIDLAPHKALAAEASDAQDWRAGFEADKTGSSYRPLAELATVAVSIANPNRTEVRMSRSIRGGRQSVPVVYDVVIGDHVNRHSGGRSRRVVYMTEADAARFLPSEPGAYRIGGDESATVVDE